jgi:hypothetical protein
MTNIPYYQKYLERVDECLHIRNNPDKAVVVCKVLHDALQKYNYISYNKRYFLGFYNNLYLSLRNYSYECKIEDMLHEINLYFDNPTQKQLEYLSNILDRLALIIKTNDDESFNQKIRYFLDVVASHQFLKDSEIVDYQYKAKQILDEYNYTPTPAKTVVMEKKGRQGCLVAFIFLIPNLIINAFKH